MNAGVERKQEVETIIYRGFTYRQDSTYLEVYIDFELNPEKAVTEIKQKVFSKKILLVEDNKINQTLTKKIISRIQIHFVFY